MAKARERKKRTDKNSIKWPESELHAVTFYPFPNHFSHNFLIYTNTTIHMVIFNHTNLSSSLHKRAPIFSHATISSLLITQNSLGAMYVRNKEREKESARPKREKILGSKRRKKKER